LPDTGKNANRTLEFAFTVFGYGSDWEERKIREIMDKEDRDQY